MKSKMCGRSVARLVVACFLSSCCCPTLSVAPPGATAPAPPGATALAPPGPSEPTIIPRGNCLESKGVGSGGPYDFCYYTLNKPLCSTVLTDCQNIAGKCSTTPPIQPNPPPC